MEGETVLNLLDSYWYDFDFFKRKSSKPPTKTSSESNPHHKIPEKPSSNQEIPAALPTIQTKSSPKVGSISQQRSDSASPNSVLFTPKLQTIFSGKEPKDFEEDSRAEREFHEIPIATKGSSLKGNIGNRRKKKGFSKSLSDLEYQELKGFMDLGFVFSEEDKDSNLASIIPGLQRLGQQSEGNIDISAFLDDKKSNNNAERLAVARPYLSESWEVLEKKRRENCLMNWKVPASVSNSEIDMKDYLRSWAHSVASTFR